LNFGPLQNGFEDVIYHTLSSEGQIKKLPGQEKSLGKE
jgi:hypothetical protein